MIPPEDLKVEIWPPRPKGGQHVGISIGVKVTHVPTGTEAISQLSRSQHRNKAIAIEMIEYALTHPWSKA